MASFKLIKNFKIGISQNTVVNVKIWSVFQNQVTSTVKQSGHWPHKKALNPTLKVYWKFRGGNNSIIMMDS